MSLITLCAESEWSAAAEALPRTTDDGLTDTAGPAAWTPLHFVAASPASPTALLKALLDAGAPLEAPASSGSTALHLAAWESALPHATVLLEAGASTRAVTAARRTPLHFAARRGHAEMLALLLQYGADPAHPDRKGRTALHFAADSGHADALRALLDAGARPLRAYDGTTPLDMARAGGNFELADALVDAFGEDCAAYAAATPAGHGVETMSRRISDIADLPSIDAATSVGVELHAKPEQQQQQTPLSSSSPSTLMLPSPSPSTSPSPSPSSSSSSSPWSLPGRWASTVYKHVESFARTLLPGVHAEEPSLQEALEAMSGDELSDAMSAYAVKGQPPKVADEYQAIVRRGVEEYRLTGALLLEKHPEPEVLVREVIESGGGEARGGLFYTLVNFVRGAREAREGRLVRSVAGSVRRDVYVAVGAGVLFSLLVPMAAKSVRK